MLTRLSALAFALLLVAAAPAPPAIRGRLPVGRGAVVHALNRLTYGPRPGDVERVKAIGLQKWIERSWRPRGSTTLRSTAKLRHLTTLTLDSETIQRDYSGPAMVERRQRQHAANAGTDQGPGEAAEPIETPTG